MKRLLEWPSRIWGAGKGRPVAFALLLFFAILLNFPDLQPFKTARLELFDHYQSLFPREPRSEPVVIVGIDEASLEALGQWPWPRNFLAALIDAINGLKPSAIGLDIIMPDPDRTNPRNFVDSHGDELPQDVANALMMVEPNDSKLARSLARAPVVLGAAGFPVNMPGTQDKLHTGGIVVHGTNPEGRLKAYPYVLASLPEFQSAAHGQAMLSSDPENGIVRRVTELSAVNGTITPGLALEMLRVAHGAPNIVVEAGGHGVEAADIGAQRILLESNGEAWVHFSRKFPDQYYVSAISLLQNDLPPESLERIRGKMVLVGFTALGLQDYITTPLGDRRNGVEAHAQLIQSFEDGYYLRRPWWMHWAELGVLLGGGLLLIWSVPGINWGRMMRRRTAQSQAVTKGNEQQASKERRRQNRSTGIKPEVSALLLVLLVVTLFGTGVALFHWGGLLFDASSLFIALGVVFGSLLSSVYIETLQQRKNAEQALQNQRLKAAQLAGELDAARRIQLGTLPVAATSFPGESRFEIDAMLEPARQVGGDLYDFFMMDQRRMFFVIGDVSGKGLPASLFMVVTKALAKSAALRPNEGIGAIVTRANMEMARENPEMLFVTAVAGILDMESGELELVNAGHDAPLRIIGANGDIVSVKGEGGPPLCVMDDFDYPVERLRLTEGDTLLLLTDGVTEAMNARRELYGMERVLAVLERAAADLHPRELVAVLREDVRVFVGDTEPSDDLTLLVLRWLGTGGHQAGMGRG